MGRMFLSDKGVIPKPGGFNRARDLARSIDRTHCQKIIFSTLPHSMLESLAISGL
jgi:hypothetical protein